ncbi:hypothetical protein LEP1GSC176_2207 [Leptospira kirschneri str. MMD1493]|uniref:hypothetical protein n=1 Tax=Leptospira kirschneri TaxID=29507 RepID=UPI0002BE165C|nr:hypothetical protein [Leptospira kirschneri]EMK05603.1 hypothetical protein LEP1GSC176_2207 [Leptospira kirschneri str. MMD1493]
MNIIEKIKQYIADNVFKREIVKNVQIHLAPDSISTFSDATFFKLTLKTHIIFSILYVITNFLLSLFNLSYIVEYTEIMRGYLVEGKISLLMYLLNAFPYNIIFFAFILIVFELYFSAISYLTVKVFGEKGVSFLKCISLAISSNIYILLSLFPVLLLFTIMPNSAKRDIFYMILFIGFVSIFVIAGIILQMISFIRMSKKIFNQNTGRAFLTWFSPIFVVFLFLVWIMRAP